MSNTDAIAEALRWAIHGFVCCAEPGVEPDLESFISNTLEMVQEDSPDVTESQVRDYISSRWDAVVSALNA